VSALDYVREMPTLPFELDTSECGYTEGLVKCCVCFELQRKVGLPFWPFVQVKF
jgi:hypothetical protein